MSRFAYTDRLDKTLVDSAKIDQMFADIDAFINAPSLSDMNIGTREIDYRNLSHQPKFNLYTKIGPQSLNIDATSYGGWYIVNGTAIEYTADQSGFPNGSLTNQPVVEVTGWMSTNDADPTDPNRTSSLSRFTIGYSTDGATTWSAMTGVSRPIQAARGYATRFYDTALQPHYITNSTAYYPFNHNVDPPSKVIAVFGGSDGLVNPTTVTHYCIMVDSTVVGESSPRCSIDLRARSMTA